MEELLFLFSVDDFFALLAILVGGLASAFYLQRHVSPRKHPACFSNARVDYQPSIHPETVEAYPMEARQALHFRMFRRTQRFDGDSDTYAILLA
ncbi:hypothetical protein T458_14285 [Brevibacillus panacihumi W25]|uniref:Uncharacterized protein n=2 Tax=Brevibacillus panacihumi TaxID=497735 RepID=V6MGA2_9BACL|nr:hypothetical protein [Brevibacillus panacihumi]EST54453.1 hypothetical protein T458_14285 [Brevibacillus panacihumi W25]RNB83481.1 hypothetical protein EDM58_05055 [Brevibacillus panacihumi]